MTLRSWTAAIAIAATASLLAPAMVLGAPPRQGTPLPDNQQPTRINRSYVGPVYVGPRSYCAPAPAAPGHGATICKDMARRSCRMWKRSGSGASSPWRRGPAISNTRIDLFWAAPYSRGYHWVLNLQHGLGVMATTCLYELRPSWDIGHKLELVRPSPAGSRR